MPLEQLYNINVEKFKSYRNVYRQGLMWGLPMNLFFIFAGASLMNIMFLGFLTWTGLWYLSLILLTANLIGYFLLKGLVASYGVFFIDKLIAHNFQHTFKIVRITRRARNILNPKSQ